MKALRGPLAASLVALVVGVTLTGCGPVKPVACPAGISPIAKADDPKAYAKYADRDHDGVVCE